MKTKSAIVIGAALLLNVAVLMLYVRMRYHRTIVFSDLSVAQTQTVSVAFYPNSIRWQVKADVIGTGSLVVSDQFSGTVSGRFATNRSGDYYSSNVTVTFIPRGQTKGKLRASFRF